MAVPRPGRRGAWLGIIWLGVAQELVTTGQQMGASGSGSPKPKINMRRLDQVQKPLLTDNCKVYQLMGRETVCGWRVL